MSDIAIRVENLSKKYTIRHQVNDKSVRTGDGLRHVLQDAVTGSWSALCRRLKSRKTDAGPLTADSPKSVTYEDFWALKDVSFEVERGEVIGIVGRNGAGKSTLLKILSRITEPTVGRVEIDGRVASLLEVGTGFHAELTGRENIFLNGAILGMSRAEVRQRFDEIVAFAEVEQFLDTPVKRYSSGMYVRLAFAVAAHLEPEILIIDEVLAVGDVEFQKKCLGKMDDIAKGHGRTVLFVSHNTDAIRALCSRALRFEKGRLVGAGSIQETLHSHLSAPNANGSRVWKGSRSDGALAIKKVSVELEGHQPEHSLVVQMHVESMAQHRPAFVALDVSNVSGSVLMQSLTAEQGYLKSDSRFHRLTLRVILPPLIPGFYSLTVWAGSHFTETLHEVRDCVRFEIHESPVRGRGHPHSLDHGCIVAKTSMTCRSGDSESELDRALAAELTF